MKRMICLLAILLILTAPVKAADIPKEVMEALPERTEEVLKNIEFSNADSFENGVERILNDLAARVKETVQRQGKSAVGIFLIVMLCSMFEGVRDGFGEKNDLVLSMVGALSVALLTIGNVDSLIGLGSATIGELRSFSKVLLPVLAAATAGTGAVTTASFQQVTVVFMVDLLLGLITSLLIPFTYLYIGVLTAASCLSSMQLSAIAEGMKKLIIWILTTGLILFTLYLSVARIISGSVDGAAIKMTKTAIAGVIPVVGGIIAEASETILAGAGVVKNTVGIFGVLAILAACAYPFLQLGIQYLLYKFTAYLAGVVGQPHLCKLVNGLSGALGLILGMTGSSALLLLISVLTCIAAVIP